MCADACYSKHRRTDVLPWMETSSCGCERSLPAELRTQAMTGFGQGNGIGRAPRRCEPNYRFRGGTIESRRCRKANCHLWTKCSQWRAELAAWILVAWIIVGNLSLGKPLPGVRLFLPPARHSTITLTMNRYMRLGVIDLVDALKRLPVISNAFENARTAGTNRWR